MRVPPDDATPHGSAATDPEALMDLPWEVSHHEAVLRAGRADRAPGDGPKVPATV
ncbi:hypothetical protein ACTPOK_11155 [Streptomyces inhibens]|uniref:hypothetical protein n=1 Tax=Streptomyces inhibens TaxID=2293571 RepID=UPI00402A6E89